MGYYIYMLRCKDKSIYTGIARDYKKRFEEHLVGKGARYTKSHKVKTIEIVFLVKNRSEASIVEAYIKSKSKKEKEYIIENYKEFIENVKEIKNIVIFFQKK